MLAAGGVALAILAWAAATLLVERSRLIVLAPGLQIGVEAISASITLVAALILFLIPENRGKQRRHWVAGGLAILGLGGLIFGCRQLLPGHRPDLNSSIYGALVTWTLAGALFLVALLPVRPPRISRRALLLTLALFCGLSGAVVAGERLLPPLARVGDLGAAVAAREMPLRGLSPWYWALAALPLGLVTIAAGAAVRQGRRQAAGGWLSAALILLAGAQLHNGVWPSAYSPVLTAADLLRLAFGATVVVGGLLDLRRVAEERAAFIERSRRLGELATLKADFTAMIAHELDSPLAAVRGYSDILATERFDPDDRAQAITTIRAETAMLTTLVADLRAVAAAERDDFAVYPRPVPAGTLLAVAAAFARTLPGDHPLTVTLPAPVRIRADPERIGQVLRNLLGNAAKYSPAGTPIELRARPAGQYLRIEIADRGPGIAPGDLARILEKFGRGRAQHAQDTPGLGVGLYLSRRILQAHGAELIVDSVPGAGAVFGFTLEIVR